MSAEHGQSVRSRSTAFRFVLVLGIANFFADMTYEGARSVTGPFLGTLGASAAIVGFTAGLGELLGYVLRSVAGVISDRTGKYWIVTIVGYIINMLAVPALALSGNWPLAAGLIVTERTGRAIRKPATEAMLSFAGKQIGRGWVFGLNEALDQAGATIGPLVISLTLFRHGNYQNAFALLLIPAVLTIAIIFAAHHFFPAPHNLEATEKIQSEHFPRAYWLYMIAAACFAIGFADFALISYHFQKTAVVAANLVPVYYAVAMAMGAIGGLVLGKLFDAFGLYILFIGFFLSALSAPLVFSPNSQAALVGMVLWGIGMGTQGSLLNAMIAGLIPANKRSTAFGFFDAVFGIAWFAGSWLMGALYDKSIVAVIIFSVGFQLLSLPIFIVVKRTRRK
ncbi:MAG TPA: MFS transporter [Chthoniobacterales bacterium]